MAIKKRITEKNGVTLSYHKISMINVQVNQQITILVESYIDESGRQYEKDYAQGLIEGEPTFPYTNAEYINIPYNETMDLFNGNITKKAYEWLKTLDKYKGATDILDN